MYNISDSGNTETLHELICVIVTHLPKFSVWQA